jgi:hypothetical protein
MNWITNVKDACHLDYILYIPKGNDKEVGVL